jgi:hypothetical protein
MEQEEVKSMKYIKFPLVILIFLIAACKEEKPITVKDLDETMIDLRAYQENLGDELKAGRLKDAEWLANGMDSVFGEIKRKFTSHRKLEQPFSYYYRVKMKEPVQFIKKAIRQGDTAMGMKGYRLLVNKCNSCHKDNDINKTVHF